MKSLKGQLLVASARLQDPNFVRSVVFLVQHGEEGALGLILNRPLETTVRQVCDQVSSATCAVEGYMHQGGPCEGLLMVLHSQEEFADAEVVTGVYFSTERDKIESIMQAGEGDSKFFVGYSGWGAGQLEKELEGGSWLVVPGNATQVFLGGDALEDQWSRLTARVTLGQYIDPERIPEDPSLN
jgi:putative transcriptional regulator